MCAFILFTFFFFFTSSSADDKHWIELAFLMFFSGRKKKIEEKNLGFLL